MAKKQPKLGAALIAALYALGGIMMFLGAFMIGSIQTVFPAAVGGGLMMIVLSAVAFGIAYGVWNMTSWGWAIALIFGAIGVASAVVAVNLPGLIIPGLTVWYLWTYKRYFRM